MPGADGAYDLIHAARCIRNGEAKRLLDAATITTAVAHKAIIDNAINTALDLVLAIKAAASCDMAPARKVIDLFALDQIEVK